MTVFCHQFQTHRLVQATIIVFGDEGRDLVFGVIEEAVEFKIEALDPSEAGKCKLDRMEDLRIKFSVDIFRIHAIKDCVEVVDLAVEIGCIDKGLGITDLRIPLGSDLNKCHTR